MDPNEGQDTLEQEAPIESQGQEVSSEEPVGSQEETPGTGMNPAWNDLLGSLPSSLHSQITPHLSKWDQGVQQKIQQVHSQYEPYKFLLENKVQPQQINYAMGVLRAIEERPQEVLQALQAYVGIDDSQEEQGQFDQPNDAEELPEWRQDPEFQRLNGLVETMAQLLVQQRQNEVQTQADVELENEINSAKEQFGDFDEEWVLTKLYNNPNMELGDAVKAYKDFEKGILARSRKPGPPVMGSGGSVANVGNVKLTDDKDRRNLIANMLQQQAQQRG